MTDANYDQARRCQSGVDDENYQRLRLLHMACMHFRAYLDLHATVERLADQTISWWYVVLVLGIVSVTDERSDNCTVRGPNYYVIATLNVLSDLSVMAIPMPLLWQVRIPLTRKLALGAVFGMGFFVIIATILRSYYSLVSLDTLPVALGWASRETFVATIAATAPGIKPLFSKSRWVKATSKGASYAYGRSADKKYGFSDPSQPGTTAVHVTAEDSRGANRQQTFEMGNWKRPIGRARAQSSSASDEKSIMEDHKEYDHDYNKDIFVTQEYAVSHWDRSNSNRV